MLRATEMAFDAVIDVSKHADWLSEFRAYVENLPDEVSKLQQRERDAKYALEMNGLYDAVESIKNRPARERLQGLALILGDLHSSRCDSNDAWQKYGTFLAKYKEQLEKASTS
jgi:hypothetical protein